MTTFHCENSLPASEKVEIQMLLAWYFKNVDRLDLLYNLRKKSRRRNYVSLRIIDYFVVNWTKSNPVTYWVMPDETIVSMDVFPDPPDSKARWFNVHESYKTNCKHYKKQGFDVFCRRTNDMFDVGFKSETQGTLLLNTNLRQLRFFAWAIDNGVLKYIEQHEKEIMDDMTDTLKYTERPTLTATDTVTHKKRKLKRFATYIQPMRQTESVGFKRSKCT